MAEVSIEVSRVNLDERTGDATGYTAVVNGVDLVKLLERASDYLADTERAPDATWWRDYLRAFQVSSILTEEGWLPIESLEELREDDPDFEPLEILDFRNNQPS